MLSSLQQIKITAIHRSCHSFHWCSPCRTWLVYLSFHFDDSTREANFWLIDVRLLGARSAKYHI